jgi:CHAT domain-containing protein
MAASSKGFAMQTQNIRHITITFICAIAISLAFGLVAKPALAQDEGAAMEEGFKKISAEEMAQFKAVLELPIKKDVAKNQLEAQLFTKYRAARALGDESILIQVLKEAVSLSTNGQFGSHLSTLLERNGEIEQAIALRQNVIQIVPPPSKPLHITLLARTYLHMNRLEQAEQTFALAKTRLADARLLKSNAQGAITMARAAALIEGGYAELAWRTGKYEQATVAINKAIVAEREDFALSTNFNEFQRASALSNLLSLMRTKVKILTDARKPEVQSALQDYLRVLKDYPVTAALTTRALIDVANMRFAQREFVDADRLLRQSLAKFTEINLAATAPIATSTLRDLAVANVALGHHTQALAEFNQLDALAGTDDKLKERVRYPFERAVVYLYNNKAPEASPLLASSADASAKQYGRGLAGRQHFFTAQSSGLQGVALWRVGTTESKAQAYPLLKAAVRDIMAPENVDYLENVGIRKELREMIFSTYIEAATQTNPADALAALGIADWLRGGLVQEALGDAAIRAAASNDALSNLVRQDQDARNEIKGLRNFLAGEAGGTASPLPQVAAQMRERIALLEKTRAEVQVKIKAAFPNYEKLVRPLPPSTAEIQAKLKADEALIVLQPTDDAVFVWAVNQNGTGAFHRANLKGSELAKLVKRLRASLDVAGIPENRRPVFDHAASQELYAKLLSPVQQGLAGKTSLIVAAGGVLGQIPFGVLQTADKDSWLIKQAAITHVPSVAAWLSMRSLPHQTASQPMLAWGDPLFNIALASSAMPTKGEVRKVDFTRQSTSVDLEKEDPRSAIKYANIPSLPETRDELTAIAKTLGADVAKDLILGSAATRESVLTQNKNGNLAKQRVVAFATHGLMAGDLPNLTQPALAMAGTKDDATNVLAPLLTLEDVLTLKLNADWVVLSACNTAAADGKAEEALSGLARGFFYAGSRSLLVTHWAVDSESAVTLTTETFKNYQSKPTQAKAESLRQAMLTVMSNPDTAHPTYWAPYALVGDGAR